MEPAVTAREKRGKKTKPKEPPVYACRCLYASAERHVNCPSCGLFNGFTEAPEWLAKVYRERPEVFERKRFSERMTGIRTDTKSGGLETDVVFDRNDLDDPNEVDDPLSNAFERGTGDRDDPDDPDDQSNEERARRRRKTGPITVRTLGRTKTAKVARIAIGDETFDHVLSGGIPEHNCLLFAGAPGAGKSTKMREVAAICATQGLCVMYAAAEEDPGVLKQEWKRQGVYKKYPAASKIIMATSSDPDAIAEAAHDKDVDVLIVDSSFMMRSKRVSGAPGKERQLNYATVLFMDLAHGTGEFAGLRKMTVLLVAHFTKGGDMAGSNTAKHEVDGAFSFDWIDPLSLKPLEDQNDVPENGYVRLKVHGKYRRGPPRRGFYQMGKHGLRPWKPKNRGPCVVKRGVSSKKRRLVDGL